MINGMFNMPQPTQQGQVKINPYIEAAKKNPLLKFPGTAPFNQNDPAWKEYMKWEQATHAGGPPDASKIATVLGIVHKAKGGFIGPRQPQAPVPNTDPSTEQGGMQVPLPMQNAPEGQAEGFNMPSTIVPPAPTPPNKFEELMRQLEGERTKDKFRSLVPAPERKQVEPDTKKRLLMMLIGGLASYLGGGTDRMESVNDFAKVFAGVTGEQDAKDQVGFDKQYEDAVNAQKERARLANQSRDDIMQQAQLAIQEQNSGITETYKKGLLEQQGAELAAKQEKDKGVAANKAAQTWLNLGNSALQGKDPAMYAEALKQAQALLKGQVGDMSPDVAINVMNLENALKEQAKQAALKTQQMEKNLTAADAALKMVGIKTDREALKLKFETETFDEDLLIKAAKVAKAQADAGKAKADVSSVGRVYSRYARVPRGVANDMAAVEGGTVSAKELDKAALRAGQFLDQARKAMDAAAELVPSVNSPGYADARAGYDQAKAVYKDMMEHSARLSAEIMRRTLGPSAKDKAKDRFMGAKASTKIPKKK